MDQTSINSLKSRLDIVEIISQSVELKKRGTNFFGLCPFHSEKTPSFSVSPSKQMFCCFGCQEKGDVISFVQKLHGVSFPEALKVLGHVKQELIPSVMFKIRQREREVKLIRRFRKWELKQADELAILCRCYRKLFHTIKTPDDLERIGGALYDSFPGLEYKLNIFNSGTDEQKFHFYTGERV